MGWVNDFLGLPSPLQDYNCISGDKFSTGAPPPLSKGQVVANSSSHISEVIHLLPGHLPSAAEEPEVPILYLAPYHLLPHRH